MRPRSDIPAPKDAAPHLDLTDAEFAELDALLAAAPAPLEPCDAVMLDGFLCGVLVQPTLIETDAWLPYAFDFEGRPVPADVDALWLSRVRLMVLRRHGALREAMNDGWFDPLILEADDEDAQASESEDDDGSDPMSAVDPVSRPLVPWVAGFELAAVLFPGLLETPDEAVMAAMARVLRHLPAQSEEQRQVNDALNREMPLPSLDAAIEELVAAVLDVHDLTSEQRYKVDTVRRDEPKVGRNERCPCGSGKKFKHCHGA
jgi:uncharacterized protein